MGSTPHQAPPPSRLDHQHIDAIVDSLPGLVYQCRAHPDGALTFPYVRAGDGRDLSPAIHALCEILRDAPHDLESFIHPEDAHGFWTSIRDHEGRDTPWSWEGRVVVAGETRWMWARSRPTTGPDGNPLWNGVVIDVTAQHRTEDRLRLSEARHRGLIEATPDLFFRLSRRGRYLDVKSPDAALLAADADVLLGRFIHDFLPESETRQWLDAIARTLDTDSLQELDYTLTTLDGQRRHFNARIIPVTENEVQAIVRDVTAQKAAEYALRLSEARHRGLIEATPDLFFRIARDGRHLDMKVQDRDGLAAEPEEIVGKTVAELLPEPEATRWLDAIATALDTQTLQELRYALVTLDDQQRFFEARIVPVNTEEVQAIVRDVTDQREAERALRLSEARHRGLIEATPDLFFRFSRDGRYLDMNVPDPSQLAVEPDEIIGRTIMELMPEPEASRIMAAVRAAIDTQTRQEIHYALTTIRGERRFFEARLVPVDESEVQAIVRDVTEQKLTSEALRASEERLRLALDAARIGPWNCDLASATVGCSPHTLALFGIDEADYDGRAAIFKDRIHVDDRPAVLAQIAEATRRADQGGSRDLHLEYRVVHPSGDIRWLRSVGRLHPDDDGRHTLKRGIVHDITDEKHHEAALLEAKDAAEAARLQAEEAARLKGSMLANMSHEIRTPLTSIIGFAEVLAETASEDQTAFVQTIQKSGQRLLETLNSVLVLAEIEAGRRPVDPQPIDLRVAVQDVLELLLPRAEAKALPLTLHLPDTPVIVHADRGALSRIVMNLVSNAIKFTHEGSVDVTVTTTPDTALLRVADSGIGISDTFRPHLFEAFRQESEGEARHYEGNGLGLSITHRLVSMLGGTITVDSHKHEGSTFTVRLPR